MSVNNPSHPRIEKLLQYIKSGLKEKDEAVRLALLAAVSGESIFFLGPPGTAKSMVSRRLRYAFSEENGAGLNYFEYLMNQFSTPDEVYGPVSLKSLEEDRYERITKGYLPEADVAFLDEIWKAGPAIQNTLLTIINEKKFHNGNTVMEVPLKVLVAASNELPAENQGLEALWDRFLIRVIVSSIQDEDEFLDLICGDEVKTNPGSPEEDIRISTDELNEWRSRINDIVIPDDIKSVITAIRQEMTLRNKEESREEKEKFYVSDRRWKKIAHLLKTSAYLNGREEVDLMDCQLIECCIWNTEKQIGEAKEIVEECVKQNGLEINANIDDINGQIKEFDEYVTNLFYSPGCLVKMNDDCLAYELKNAEHIIGESPYQRNPYQYGASRTQEHVIKYVSEGAYYSWHKEKVTIVSHIPEDVQYDKNTKQLSWRDHQNYNREINSNDSEEYVKNLTVFNTPDLLQLRQNKAEDQYRMIAERITKENDSVEKYMEIKSEPYKANLFADQNMCSVILKEGEKSKLELKKAMDELEKIRERYQCSSTAKEENVVEASEQKQHGTNVSSTPYGNSTLNTRNGTLSKLKVQLFAEEGKKMQERQWKYDY